MDEFDDETLDAGIASDLDVPTALAAAERDEPPNNSTYGRSVAIAMLAAAAYLLIRGWLH